MSYSFSRDGTDFLNEDGYGTVNSVRSDYSARLYSPHTQEHPHHSVPLTSLLESQKTMMSMFKDLTERIGTLESAVSDLSAKVDSTPPTSCNAEEKKRIPSVLTVWGY